MKILKYRTIAEIYPYLSLEAMIQLDSGKIVYTNLSVNDDGEQEDDCEYWTYTHALDDMDLTDHDITDYQYDLSKEDDVFVYETLLEFWNSNPVFDHDYDWKEFAD